MSVELQIVEHKDCQHCYQPIDERAQVCPFCRLAQKRDSKLARYIARGLGATLVVGVLGLGVLLDSERSSRLDLQGALVDTQRDLVTARSAALAYASADKRDFETSLNAAALELRLLVSRAQSRAQLVSSLCSESSLLELCDQAQEDTASDSIALARLMGRFDALDSNEYFCDQLRPLLTGLTRLSSISPAAEMRDRYYLATAGCWQSS